jgi:cytoskeletal protein RodZ
MGLRDNQQPLNEKSRSLQRAKRRKTNIVLNSLIVIVLLLIGFVTVNIFFGNDKTANEENGKAEIENNTETANALSQEDKEKEDKEKEDKEKEDKNTDSQDKETTSEDEKTDNEQNDPKDIEDQEIVTEGSDDPKVEKSIVNPAWEPVGTSQTGQHSSVYSGVDWDEMTQAITYATGLAI